MNVDSKFQDSVNWNVRDELKGSSLDIIKMSRQILPYAVAMVNINGELNIGTSIRASEILGARAFWMIGKKHYDKRSTVGAQNYIQIYKNSVEEFIEFISRPHSIYEPIFIETGGKPFDAASIDLFCASEHKIPLFIFGSEAGGIPEELLNIKPNNVYSIKQYGVLRSLNVSSAVSVVLGRYVDYLEN